MVYLQSSEPNNYDVGDWLPVPPTPEHHSAYASPPPEAQHYDSNLNSDSSVAQGEHIPKSYIPPFARADRWRPSYPRHDRSDPTSLKRDCDHYLDAPPRESGSTKETYSKAPSESNRVMPKHFQKPLTCFYWANQGHCNKSAADCWYAHYWTGVIAAAPVRVGHGNPVAGRVAERVVDEATAREHSIQEREALLIARERDLTVNEEAIENSAANLKLDIERVFHEMNCISIANADACRALERRRTEIATVHTKALDPRRPSTPFHDFGTQLLKAVDGAIGALIGLQDRIDGIERHMKAKVGNCEMEETAE